MYEEMRRTAMIIGGTGQIGVAAARRLATDGWSVLLIHHGENHGDPTLADLDVTTLRMDRDLTEPLLAEARGHDLVLDTIAFTARHANQLVQLAGDVGSVVVISTASVYSGRDGTYLDVADGADSPDFPVPLREGDATVDSSEPTYSPMKAAMERRLWEAEDLPVSILRPGAIHGPFSPAPREWYFAKRAVDGRKRVALAFDGTSRFATSATANIAELVALCARKPGRRILNAVDEEAPTVAEIARTVFEQLGREVEIVPFSGPPRGAVGQTPWSLPRPLVLSMDAAKAELGYRQPLSFARAIDHDVDWMVRAVLHAERNESTWREVFPNLVRDSGADGWFDYAAEDAFLDSRH